VLTPGEELIVRASVEGHVIAFWATVIEKIERAGTFYLLSYPEQVETLDLRRAERMNVFVPTRIELKREDSTGEQLEAFEGALVNLSRDGCCLSAGNTLDENLWCKLSFTLPGRDEVFEVEGRVVRKIGGEGDVARMGVQFAKGSKNVPIMGELQQWLSSNIAFLRA
jgi:hypothetical protein